MEKAGGGFTRLVNVERVGRDGLAFDIQATEDECRVLAQKLGILGVSDVRAAGSLVRQSGTGQIALTAKLAAEAVQACVVTLEPVSQVIDEEFTVFYTFDQKDLVIEDVDKVVGLDDEELPELIVNNRIDLADMISEQIALALDPYPRSSSLPAADPADDGTNDKPQEVYRPFANLRDLMSKK